MPTFNTNQQACTYHSMLPDLEAKREAAVKLIAKVDQIKEYLGDHSTIFQGVCIRFTNVGSGGYNIILVEAASKEIIRSADIYKESAGFSINLCDDSGTISDTRTRSGSVGCGYTSAQARAIAVAYVAKGIIPEISEQVWEDTPLGDPPHKDQTLDSIIDKNQSICLSEVEGIDDEGEEGARARLKAWQDGFQAWQDSAKEARIRILAQSKADMDKARLAAEGVVDHVLEEPTAPTECQFQIVDVSMTKKERKELARTIRKQRFDQAQLQRKSTHATHIEVPPITVHYR